MSFPSSNMFPLDSKRSFRMVSSILCRDGGMKEVHSVLECVWGYLELCLGFVDIDDQFVSLLLKIRSLQPHYITVDAYTV